ncbi:hypothetical protein KSC_015110 [Ktedonobacter sp. SOSP1-52]|uniref:phosphotransferase family protein n=1 Tax=Ktedonobacter sp. SOSP1-52 TaxID=2778366 RepID=UPI00191540E4|nr:phosphotransferase [Ktedonobacter sp. SOSP1-52]GHO62619.1 hypothetical protein KSC_015110 [Ktedonobacter sp. SOSP1-52]
MSHEHLDPHAILETLGLLDVTAVAPVHGGTDTAIWRVEKAGTVYALRVFQKGEDDDCQREQVVMQAALAAGLPVPQVHAMGKWHDYPALLLSWLPGRPVAEELRAHPWRAWSQGVLFGQMQATIHTLAAPEVLCQQPEAWIKWSGPDEKSLQECLHRAKQQALTLLHLDYHPLNVLTDGNKITAVLDWRNALSGDPRADAARTVSILRYVSLGRRSILELLVLRIFEAGWRSGYEQKRGALGDMNLFYAWASVVMERDLATKLTQKELSLIHQWTLKWKKRIGCL